MSLIYLSLSFLFFCVSIGAVISIFVFIIDVFKWHNREERVKVVPSIQKLPDDLLKESPVISLILTVFIKLLLPDVIQLLTLQEITGEREYQFSMSSLRLSLLNSSSLSSTL